jgi:hypothetical protein
VLTMPAGHSDAELTLARAVARRLGSAELHVFWEGARPAARGSDREAASGSVRALAVVGAVWDAIARTLVARSR